MTLIIFIHDSCLTEFTLSCSSLTFFEMFAEGISGDIKLTVDTVFGLQLTVIDMTIYFVLFEFNRTKLTFLSRMILFLVLLIKIFIIRLSTYLTLYDISSAVAEVSGVLGSGDVFVAVLASFDLFHASFLCDYKK